MDCIHFVEFQLFLKVFFFFCFDNSLFSCSPKHFLKGVYSKIKEFVPLLGFFLKGKALLPRGATSSLLELTTFQSGNRTISTEFAPTPTSSICFHSPQGKYGMDGLINCFYIQEVHTNMHTSVYHFRLYKGTPQVL